MRAILAALLAFLALVSQSAMADICQQSGTPGGPAPGQNFTTQALAEAFCAAQSKTYLTSHTTNTSVQDVFGSCHTDGVNKTVWLRWISQNQLLYQSGTCGVNKSAHNQDWTAYTYNTGKLCSADVSSLLDLWSTGYDAGSLPGDGTDLCYQACVKTIAYNSAPHYVAQFDRWTAQATLNPKHISCPTSNPPPDAEPPPNPLPDADSDGIPDSSDPFPNNPNNTPPIPPTPPTPPAPPTTGSATNLALADLGILLSGKLDILTLAVIANKLAIDAVSSGNAVNTSAIVAAIAGLPHGTTGGTGTDMTATNALLTDIKSNTTKDTATNGMNCSVAPTFSNAGSPQAIEAFNAWSEHCEAAGQRADSGNGLSGGLSTAGSNTGFIDETDHSGTDGTGGLDDSGWGWSRSCPSPPTFVVFGRTFTIPTAPLCSWLTLGGALVLIFAALASIKIMATT
jgi:hypothetical protein